MGSRLWGLACGDTPTVQVTIAAFRRLRSSPRLTVHRRDGFAPQPPHAVVRRGLPVVRLERALAESWPLLSAATRRAPLIRAVAEGMTTPGRVSDAAAGIRALPDRSSLTHLLRLLDEGCRSELEIWGYESVFNGSGMPVFRRQERIRLGSRTFYLDVYAEAERVNFELDGAEWHASPTDRERDLRRDAALAAFGILVVRFTHRRLAQEPEQVRREVLAILTSRRAAGDCH